MMKLYLMISLLLVLNPLVSILMMNKSFLFMLLSLEASLLGMIYLMTLSTFSSSQMLNLNILITLSISATEASTGLAIMVLLLRSTGTDMTNLMPLIKS